MNRPQRRFGYLIAIVACTVVLIARLALNALAKKAGVPNGAVSCMTIWGNHSNTQYPDFTNAKINGKPAIEVITDRAWLEQTFVPRCRTAGRPSSRPAGCPAPCRRRTGRSTTSRAWFKGTTGGDWTSSAMVSKGEYGVPAGLVFGYPCTATRQRELEDRRGAVARRLRAGEVQDHAQRAAGRARRGEGVAGITVSCPPLAASPNAKPQAAKSHPTTTLTIFLGTTIHFLMLLPAIDSCTFSSASAATLSASSSISAGTFRRLFGVSHFDLHGYLDRRPSSAAGS